ncbi:hypothetical protein MUK42_23560 [Musa troglodytarum]|uniref:Uncharacterized protein n=1 Tax=Musa troglodytarum TaxID=320322 RepID=A0A9E7K9F6_9LILI|nr:hypothetical protein MUK42_23560 [Musa troglodytarum]
MELHSPRYNFAKGYAWCAITVQTGPSEHLARMAAFWKCRSDWESETMSKKKRVTHNQLITTTEGRRCRFAWKSFSPKKRRCNRFCRSMLDKELSQLC